MRGIEALNGIVWGPVGLGLLFGTGLLLTVRTGGFQLRRWGYWMRHTLGAILTDQSVTAHTAREEQAISQFQSMCTALAGTIGTGNIVGVATAIVSGGAGAVFWMWVMALLGMMTSYAENVLGIYYRRRNSQGEWSGGAMYYLKDGLGGRKHCKTIGSVLAVLFSIFAILASFGIGNDISMQVVGVGFIISVLEDACETALNSSSDVLFTATAEFAERRKNGTLKASDMVPKDEH